MNLKFKLIAFLLMALVFNCKKASEEKTLNDFKFTEKGIVVSCNDFDVKLLNEALFSFEEDILNAYGQARNSSTTPNLSRAYSQFISNATYGRVKYNEVVSPQSAAIFEVLKSKSSLWNTDTSKGLNYNHPIVSCISENILDKDLKTTFNALLETNSMSAKLFTPALQSNYGAVYRDKYLSTYVALELFYGRLFGIDLSKVSEKTEEKVDFNKIPQN